MSSDEHCGHIDYQPLKDWIAAQEAYEAANSKPAPLQPHLREALSVFVAALVEAPLKPDLPEAALEPDLAAQMLHNLAAATAEPALPADPDLGGTNWVGMLNEYGAKTHAKRTTIKFHDWATPRNLWQCSCTFFDSACTASQKFPAAGDAVAFSTKRDAKSYAAMRCVKWLRATGRMAGPADQPSSCTDDDVLDGGGQPNARQRAHELCTALGLPPLRYTLSTSKVPGYWSGGVELMGLDAVDQFAWYVENVYGQKAAKERLAVNVVECLEKIQDKRAAQLAMSEEQGRDR